MSRSVFNRDKNLDVMKQPMFFGEDLQVQQYSDMKYPIFDKLNQQNVFENSRSGILTFELSLSKINKPLGG